MIRLRPLMAGSIGWAVGAASAVTVGLLALSLVGEDLTGGPAQPFSADAYAPLIEPLASPEPAPTGATVAPPKASTTGAPAPAERRFNSAGGYVVARCRAAGAYLVYWSPAQGYRAEDVMRGPAEVARVTFKGLGREIELEVRCTAGDPRTAVKTEREEGSDR